MLRTTSYRLLLPVALMTFLLLPYAFSQETTAGLQGTVKDPSGAVVAGATIEVTSPALIGTRKAQSDSAGIYRFAALPPGEYTITANAAGFRTVRLPGIELNAGRLPSIDIRLEVGAVAETVEVSGTATSVDVTQSKVAVNVSQEVIDNIPKGRSFQSLITLAPGARQEPLQGGTTSRGNGFQIDGASDSENVYLIDGVNTTQIQNGGVGTGFNIDFIEEVQIKSSGFEAEYGGAMGGVVNAVPKRGANIWHGALKAYWRTNALNANDPCASGYTSSGYSTVCGQRLDPTQAGLNSSKRLDGTPQYYLPRKDQRNIVEPGFEIGGPVLKDRLWLFSSYIPYMDTIRRTTTFTGNNPGPRTLTQTTMQHNMYNRLDYRLFDTLRLFAAWNYAYSRVTGQLGVPDSAVGQLNTGASTDPNTLRSDQGSVNPLAVWSFGGDWTPTSRIVVTTRFGYFFNNIESRGIPTGTRYIYQDTINASSTDLAGNPYPSSSFNTAGYANIPSNLGTVYDAYKRKGLNVDGSYFFSGLAGTHTFKTGYFRQWQSNDVLRTFLGGAVNLFWGENYQPVTSTTACDGIMSANQAAYGKSICQGLYGYFVVGTNVVNTGGTTQTADALYLQDSWNVGHGLSLNLGVRFDKESLPAYDPTRFPSVNFGWGDKFAPRLGGAYDVLHNGKLKVFASYGKFYDIMKMGLARGSFGSDYWHNCVYALDTLNYSGTIKPSYPIGGGCPATGAAPGVTGRFIENVDFRATKADKRDPAIQPTMKPMGQHEVAVGVDWAISNNWSLESRYSRKILDQAIEDMAITDNLGFYIGNPGSSFADVLHRPVVIPDANGNDYLTSVPFCAECPGAVPAMRRYNGAEFRLVKRATASGHWGGQVSYTLSSLRGNYAGLTNTDPTDGGGGRHAPNNGRAFDIPTMTYLPNGKIDDGPLSTDRTHTATIFGFYRVRWFKGETLFGLSQVAYEGSSMSSCLPVVGTSSACQWADGRGNFVTFTRDSSGNFVVSKIDQGARTAPLFSSNVSVRHEIPVGEGKFISGEINIDNLLNQHAAVAYQEIAVAGSGLISPSRTSRFSGDPGVDWGKVMHAYNYADGLNGTGAFAGVQSPVTFRSSAYGLPTVFQQARNMRLTLRFTF